MEQCPVGIDEEGSCEESGNGELLQDLGEGWEEVSGLRRFGVFSFWDWVVERWWMEWKRAGDGEKLVRVHCMVSCRSEVGLG